MMDHDVSSAYERALHTLYNALPMFQRDGPSAYKKDLATTERLCDRLGNPHRRFRSVHVGGTNGKGSSAHLIAAALQCAGYKTGLYTSPHLKAFTERIKVDGEEVDKAFVVSFLERVKADMDILKPSFFELTVAMAFDYFAYREVDVAVIEVGLGGRLDSTNILDPQVSLITRIDFDHQDLLGDTLPLIAAEKAGIIKPGRMAVIGETQPEVRDVFLKKASSVGAPIRFAQDEYTLARAADGWQARREGKPLYNLTSSLTAGCQRRNIVSILPVLDELVRQGFTLPIEAIQRGIREATTLTGLKGRWQRLADAPTVYCDVAHNEAGIKEVLHEVAQRPYRRLHLVIGAVRDKPSMPVLRLLPADAQYYFCQARIPRALPAAALRDQAAEAGLRGEAVADVNHALAKAVARAHPEDLIVVTGSTFVVAEIEGL